MQNFLIDTLTEALNPKDGKLKDNALAHYLFIQIKNNKELLFVPDDKRIGELVLNLRTFKGLPILDESEQPVDEPVQLTENPVKTGKQHVDDFRIQTLFFRGVRKFNRPLKKDGSMANAFFSVDFTNKGETTSKVLVGGNGVGKTSIFHALEYMYLKRLPSIERMKIQDVEDFLQCKVKDPVSWEMIADTEIGREYEYNPNGSNSSAGVARDHLSCAACFCSQHDVEVIEESESLGAYLYDQLDLGLYYRLVTGLDDVIELEKEINDRYYELKDRLKQLNEEYANIVNYHLSEELFSYEPSFKIKRDTEIKRIQNEIIKKEYEMEMGFRSLHSYDFINVSDPITAAYQRYEHISKEDLEMWNREIEEVRDLLKDKLYNKLLDLYTEVLKPMISDLTTPHFEDIGKCELKFVDLRLDLNIALKSNGIESVHPPVNRILNTFRLKVFTISLKFALACCAMKIHNTVFPIVIDDIFDSSDFDHRAQIDAFFEKTMKNYMRVMGERYPAQIIYFTQDELIAEGVERGLQESKCMSGVTMGRIIEEELLRSTDILYHKHTSFAAPTLYRKIVVDIPSKLDFYS